MRYNEMIFSVKQCLLDQERHYKKNLAQKLLILVYWRVFAKTLE